MPARTLNRERCRHLPVIDAGRLVGIISDRDVLLASTLRDRELAVPECPVASVMTPHPLTCTRSSSLADAARAMIGQKIDSLVVVDAGGHVTGILTSTDLMKWFARPGAPSVGDPLGSMHQMVVTESMLHQGS